jgi:vancomycin resistance protein VanW
LRRASVNDERLQAGKERNVTLAASRIDRVILQPGETFSYHRLIGWPSWIRGFRNGLELRDGKMSSGLGGGCCQISNLLYLLALRAGLEIVERHRHALDLFPDHGRTVPFGCGATVFYNSADLKFRNPHPFPVLLHLRIVEGALHGEVRLTRDVDLQIEVYEKDHHFRREGESWYRENRIWRKSTTKDGVVLKDEEVVHNVGRCLYDPEASDD